MNNTMRIMIYFTLIILFAHGLSFSQTNTFPSSGNVGIGMLNPTYKLEVSGNTLIRNGGLAVGNNILLNDGASFGTTYTDYTPSQANWTTTGTTLILNAQDYSTIGFHDSGTRVDFIRAGQGNIQLGYNGGWGEANIKLPGNGIWSSNGNVGIGTLEPVFKLDVAGNFKVSTPNSYMLIDNVNSGENYYSASSFHSFQIAGVETFRISGNGNVGIGSQNPDEKLTVKGRIHAEEVRVDLSVPGPDYVFEKDYPLTPLTEIQTYIQENKHLPEVPSAKEMKEKGINLSEMNMLLLKKVEELTLHLIKQESEITELKRIINKKEK